MIHFLYTKRKKDYTLQRAAELMVKKKKKKKSGLYKESLRGYRRGSEAFASITEITFL